MCREAGSTKLALRCSNWHRSCIWEAWQRLPFTSDKGLSIDQLSAREFRGSKREQRAVLSAAPRWWYIRGAASEARRGQQCSTPLGYLPAYILRTLWLRCICTPEESQSGLFIRERSLHFAQVPEGTQHRQ